jgi:hypothetical protein
MKIGVLVPDRNDRPLFLRQCLRMIGGQTLKPDFVFVVNYEPSSEEFDLTQRVRRGFETLKNNGADVVLIMENDDFYSVNYIETMVQEFKKSGEPFIFGTDFTIYYHIKKREFRKLSHPGRASLMNTLLRVDAPIIWPSDSEIYLDLFLWSQIKGKTFSPKEIISLGIKHGFGLCGGSGHVLMRFDNQDFNFKFLKSVVDEERFKFYSSI